MHTRFELGSKGCHFKVKNYSFLKVSGSLGDDDFQVDGEGDIMMIETLSSLPEFTKNIKDQEISLTSNDSRHEFAVFKLSLLKDNRFINNCLKNYTEDGSFSEGVFIVSKDDKIYFPNCNYQRIQDGRLEFLRQDLIAKQRSVFMWVLKKLGSALLSGKNPFLVPLPVYIFDYYSFHQRVANTFGFMPLYLERACQVPHDPAEQIRLIVTYFLSSLHLNIEQQKPFNPILGETFQGFIDGNPIYFEQISHHPPIFSMQFYGKGYKVDGTFETTGKVSTSGALAINHGLYQIRFDSDEHVIYVRFPRFRIEGLAFGKRTCCYASKLVIFDPKNLLLAKVKLDPDRELYSIFHKDKLPSDGFRGGIYSISPDFALAKLAEIKKKEIMLKSKPKHYLSQVSKVEGTWMDKVIIDDVRYWKLGERLPFRVVSAQNPLPSDSTYREDILYVMKDDLQAAEVAKESLENLQRHDKALRQAAKSK